MKTHALIPLSLALALSACGKSLTVETYEPPAVPVGGARTLVLTDGYGRASALEAVAWHLRDAAFDDGYYAFEDLGDIGARLEVYGSEAELFGARPEPGSLYLRVDVLEWYAFDESHTETHTREDGVVEERQVVTRHGVALLGATLADADGELLLLEREYEGVYEGPADAIDDDEAITSAARAALEALLDEITPRRVRQSIPLDASDEEQEPILEMATNGQLSLAIEEMERYVEEHPYQASARYNLGAFLDAAARYEAALEAYEEAIRLGDSGFYARTRTACERRLRWAEALELR